MRTIENEIYQDRDSVIVLIPIEQLSIQLHKLHDSSEQQNQNFGSNQLLEHRQETIKTDLFKLKDFNEIKTFEKNQQFKLVLIQSKLTDKLYYMKSTNISEAKSFKVDKYMTNEIEVCERMNHPFILPYIKHIISYAKFLNL